LGPTLGAVAFNYPGWSWWCRHNPLATKLNSQTAPHPPATRKQPQKLWLMNCAHCLNFQVGDNKRWNF